MEEAEKKAREEQERIAKQLAEGKHFVTRIYFLLKQDFSVLYMSY